MTRAWAEIDLSAIRHNFIAAAKHVEPYGAKAVAVVKANAYGHGAVKVAADLEKNGGAEWFAVAAFSEAVELAESGITSPIIILSEIHSQLYEELVRYPNIIPSIFHFESAVSLSEAAVKKGVSISCFLALDTGMSRIGIATLDAHKGLETVKRISELPNIKIEGIFSHYACADHEDKASAMAQTENFDRFVKLLRENGIAPTYLSMCNSAALIENAFPNKYDLVREGISLYGYYPSAESEHIMTLKPAIALRTLVTEVKELEAGIGVGYGHTYITKHKTRVATLSIGYADGYPRLLSNRGGVVIDGEYAPIIGRICMDQMMVDVTDIPSAKVGSIATLMGADERIRADKIGEMIGTIPHELVCGLTARIPHVYINDDGSLDFD